MSWQIVEALTLHRTYLLLNEARRFDETVSQNGMLAQFIDRGWLYTQASLLRTAAFDTQDAACSVQGVVSDLKCSLQHVTRKAYVTFDGAPYRFEEEKIAWLSNPAQEAALRRGPAVATRITGSWKTAEDRHRRFDEMARVAADARKPDDRLSQNWIDETWKPVADLSATIEQFTNHFVAHKRQAKRIAKLQTGAQGLSIARVEAAWRAISRASNRLAGFVTESQFAVAQTVRRSDLQYLDRVFASHDQLEKLRHSDGDNIKRLDSLAD